MNTVGVPLGAGFFIIFVGVALLVSTQTTGVVATGSYLIGGMGMVCIGIGLYINYRTVMGFIYDRLNRRDNDSI